MRWQEDTTTESQGLPADAAIDRARAYALDDRHLHGCAEIAYLVLHEVLGGSGSPDPSIAMALNGGIAYSGGPCGAVSGAALALGELAGRRIADHAAAKRAARIIVGQLIDDFTRVHGTVDCRELIGVDLRAPDAHDAFLASGAWQDRCLAQIEFVVRRLAPLAAPESWDRATGPSGPSDLPDGD